MIPHIIYDIGLKANEIAVYCAIKCYAGEDGYCTKSYGNLAKSVRLTRKTVIGIVHNLCQINPIVHKSLISKSSRFDKNGDSDTNIIVVNDLWGHNEEKPEKEGGGVNSTPPSVKITPGVVYNLHQGGVKITPKQEPLNKNPFNKTTTPTPSNSEFVHKSSSFSKEMKEAAIALKAWIDTQASAKRSRKEGTYRTEVEWGNSWVIPLTIYENLIEQHGLEYFQRQLEYMVSRQKKFDEGKTVIDIKCPLTLKSFCQLVDCKTIQEVRDNHKDGEKYFWQLVSNAILTGAEHAELIIYVPYQSELEDIRELARNTDEGVMSKYYWIHNATDDELPFLIEGGHYKNLNVIRFDVSKEDKAFLTERVAAAGKLLEPFKTDLSVVA